MSAIDSKMLLRPREVVDVTGYSRSMVYALIASGEIPSVRVGRTVRVPTDALKQWIGERMASTDRKEE